MNHREKTFALDYCRHRHHDHRHTPCRGVVTASSSSGKMSSGAIGDRSTWERLLSPRTEIYPGSAPLNRGKDLLPASLLLLFTRSRLQGSGSYNSGAGDFSLVARVSFSLRAYFSQAYRSKVQDPPYKGGGSPDLQSVPSSTHTRNPTLGFVLPN